MLFTYFILSSILISFNMHCSWLVCCKHCTMYSSLDLGFVLHSRVQQHLEETVFQVIIRRDIVVRHQASRDLESN